MVVGAELPSRCRHVHRGLYRTTKTITLTVQMPNRPRVPSSSHPELRTSESTKAFINNDNNDEAVQNNYVYNGENYDKNDSKIDTPSPCSADVKTSASFCDIVFIILRGISFPIDYVSDIGLMIDYFSPTSEMAFGFLTLLIITLSGIARTWICYRMRLLDKQNVTNESERTENNVIQNLPKYQCRMLHVLSLFKASTWLYTWNCLYYACNSRSHGPDYKSPIYLHWISHVPYLSKFFPWLHNGNCTCNSCESAKSRSCSLYYKLFLREQMDASLLGIVGGCTEAAPQLILQLYIIWMKGLSLAKSWFKIICSCITLVVLGLTSGSFYINIRIAQRDKETVTRTGKVLVWFWQFFIIASCILLILIALRMWFYYTLLVYFFIWMGWTGWIYYKKDGVVEFSRGRRSPDMATETTISEKITILFISIILGAVYLFMYVNLSEKPTLCRYLCYYMLRVIEISIVVAVCVTIGSGNLDFSCDWYAKSCLFLSVLSFLIGISCMVIYHQCFHPTANDRKSQISSQPRTLESIRRTMYDILKYKKNRNISTQNGNAEPEKHNDGNNRN